MNQRMLTPPNGGGSKVGIFPLITTIFTQGGTGTDHCGIMTVVKADNHFKKLKVLAFVNQANVAASEIWVNGERVGLNPSVDAEYNIENCDFTVAIITNVNSYNQAGISIELS